jgi:hypothetical protein
MIRSHLKKGVQRIISSGRGSGDNPGARKSPKNRGFRRPFIDNRIFLR